MRRVCLIVNPKAGGGRTAKALPAVETELRRLGVEHRVTQTLSIDHAIELARQAGADGEVAVSFGGDGLAGAVAHAVRDTGGVMGILPGGRGNDFVRKLEIPGEPVPACDVLAAGVERTVDVGDVDGRTFLGIASYGFDSEVQDLANETNVVKGSLVYLYATVRSLAGWKPVRFTYAADGGPEESFSGYAVAASNSGRFGGGMKFVPDADLEDGLIDVVLSGDEKKLVYLRDIPKVFKGTHLANEHMRLFRAREIRVDSERPFRIYADGDPIGTTPAVIRAVPRAVRVLVPA